MSLLDLITGNTGNQVAEQAENKSLYNEIDSIGGDFE